MIETTGLNELMADLTAAAVTIEPKVNVVRDHTKSKIRQTAVDLVPVDEGTLRDSIRETEDGVEATAPHADFVERGTYKDAPQPFMDPAADEHEDEFALGVLTAGTI